MRVLMISIDRTLLGANSGDSFERHKEYAERIGQLDIIVFSKKGFKKTTGGSLTVYPTNSTTKLNYIWDTFQIAKNICFPNKFDLIVCQDPFLTGLVGWLLKKRFKIPLLIHFHGDFWENRYWLSKPKKWWHSFWHNRILLFLSKFLVDGADGIRVVSVGIKDKLIRGDVLENKIRVISTPIDLEKFEKSDDKRVGKLRLRNKGYKTIINIGLRDASAKDYPTLFKTIDLVHEKYRNLAFCQIGSGICLQDETKESTNLLLTCVGEISQKELIDYYHSSDVYVSSSCNESFGKVLIEAMAAGLPVVATATTGSKEIVVDGVNGFLIPVGDSVTLAKKILFLLNNSEKAREMGQAGRKMVKERFGKEKIIGQMIGFWEVLAKQ